jgi:hypothetical protein
LGGAYGRRMKISLPGGRNPGISLKKGERRRKMKDFKNLQGQIIFDNGGGVILRLPQYSHYYSYAPDAAEDFITYITDETVDGWEGNEEQLKDFEPSDVEKDGYRVYTISQIVDLIKSKKENTGWTNIDMFCTTLAKILTKMIDEEVEELMKLMYKEIEEKECFEKLVNIGWVIEDKEKMIVSRIWNLAEVDAYGDYTHLVENRPEGEIIDKVYIKYYINLSDRETYYEVWEGGRNPGNAIAEYDDFEGVLDLALEDKLFIPVKPLQFETLINSSMGRELLHTWYDLVQITADYKSCIYEAESGEYYIRLINNCNVKPDESTVFMPIEKRDAEKILEIYDNKGINEAITTLINIANEKLII